MMEHDLRLAEYIKEDSEAFKIFCSISKDSNLWRFIEKVNDIGLAGEKIREIVTTHDILTNEHILVFRTEKPAPAGEEPANKEE